MQDKIPHVPILVPEIISLLKTNNSGIYLDCTVGFGGHASAILTHLESPGRLIGLDSDVEALKYTEQFLSKNFDSQLFSLHHTNHRRFPEVLKELGIQKVNGILMDVGISSYNIDSPERGFSFQNDGPLDMRFDQSTGKTAADYLNTVSERELGQIIRVFGEERFYKKIAQRIVDRVHMNRMSTTNHLREAIASTVSGKYELKTTARVFQAIRIKINDELNAIQESLEFSIQYLAKGGRIAVISFHSLEDRIVKTFFRENSRTCSCPPELPQCICSTKPAFKQITRKPILASQAEILANSRSRSAKLRIAERI